MSRVTSLPVVRTAIAFLFVAAAAKAGTTVFGPETFIMAAGQPQTLTRTVNIDPGSRCDGKAAYFLVAESTGVSSARVELNGTAVFRDDDFNGGSVRLEQFVNLRDSNDVRIGLKGGKAGSALVVSIRREIEVIAGAETRFVLTANRQTFRTNIVLPSGEAAPYVLTIVNGESDGSGRVNAGAVSINGAEVAGERLLHERTPFVRAAVTLAGQADLVADLRGQPGDSVTLSLRQQLDESACAPKVFIDTPASGEVLPADAVFVTGRATGSRDIGVSVNGVAAELSLAAAGTTQDPFHWFVRLNPPAGPLAITATVVNTGGARAQAEVHAVVEETVEGRLRLIATPSAEVVPAEIVFTVENQPEGITRFEADLDGDGVFEIDAPSMPPLVRSFDSPGIRRATIRVSAGTSPPSAASAWISLLDLATMDTLLKQRWNTFRSAVRSADLAAALNVLSTDSGRAKYGPVLTRLAPYFAEIGARVRDIDLIYIRPSFAAYLLTREEAGDEAGYYLYFTRDDDGIWRIEEF